MYKGKIKLTSMFHHIEMMQVDQVHRLKTNPTGQAKRVFGYTQERN